MIHSLNPVSYTHLLDVRNGVAENNAIVQQYSRNNSQAQRWFIRDSGAGYYLQSALGNWVLDLSGGNTANGAAIRPVSYTHLDVYKRQANCCAK